MKIARRFITVFFITAVVLIAGMTAIPHLPILPSVTSSEAIRESLFDATDLEVFEGLPHQLLERELLACELESNDTIEIKGFPFYVPSSSDLSAVGGKELIEALSDSSHYSRQQLLEFKKCGGFHPDYAIGWNDDLGKNYVLICLGCHEIEFSNELDSYRYDISCDLYSRLSSLLSVHDVRRPLKS